MNIMRTARPEYIAAYFVDEATATVKIQPVMCHAKPAIIPPTSAEKTFTFVLGIT